MTNKEMTLNVREEKMNLVANLLTDCLQQPLQLVARYYGEVLERQLNTRQVLALLNAQLAFVLTVFPAECPTLMRLVCCGWLLTALLRCKRLL